MFISKYTFRDMIDYIKESDKPIKPQYIRFLENKLEAAEKKDAERAELRKQRTLALRRELYEILAEGNWLTCTQIQYRMAEKHPMISLPKISGNLRAMLVDDEYFPDVTCRMLDKTKFYIIGEREE